METPTTSPTTPRRTAILLVAVPLVAGPLVGTGRAGHLARPVRRHAQEERARLPALRLRPHRAVVRHGKLAHFEQPAAGALAGGGIPGEAGLEDRGAQRLGHDGAVVHDEEE